MQMQIEVAALIVLVGVMTIGGANAESPENGESPPGDSILTALGIQASPQIDISKFDWIDPSRVSVEVIGKSVTKPRGLFKVIWNRRQVAEIELVTMEDIYCDAAKIDKPCYLIASANEHDELKAPLGTWHVTNEDVEEIYRLPSVGKFVHIDPGTLMAASQQ